MDKYDKQEKSSSADLDKVFWDLVSLQTKTSKVIQEILPLVRSGGNMPFYDVLESPWSNIRSYRWLDYDELPELKEIQGTQSFNREMWHQCLGHVLGNMNEACVVPKDCWSLVTAKGASGHTLKFQALYFILAEAAGKDGDEIKALINT